MVPAVMCPKHGPHGRVVGCAGCLEVLRIQVDLSNERDRAEWMRNNVVVPRELLLSWAAGLVRSVCGVADDIGEPVRKTAMQIKRLADSGGRS